MVSGTGTIDGVTLAEDARLAPVSSLKVVNGLTLDHANVSLYAGHSTNLNVGSFTTLSFAGILRAANGACLNVSASSLAIANGSTFNGTLRLAGAFTLNYNGASPSR